MNIKQSQVGGSIKKPHEMIIGAVCEVLRLSSWLGGNFWSTTFIPVCYKTC